MHSVLRWGQSHGELTLARALQLGCVLFAAWALAHMAWRLGGHDNRLTPAPAAISNPRTPAPAPALTLPVAEWHLFGSSATATNTDAPETGLALELRGVFAGTDSQHSGAIIAPPGQPGELYSAGAVLPGNVTLEQVQKDRVLLNRNGQQEILRFLDDRKNTSPLLLQSVSSQCSGPMCPGAEGQRMPRTSDYLREASQSMQTQPQQFLQELGLQSDGKGFRITGSAPEKILTTLGLKPGDRLLSINGVSADSIGNAQRIASLLAQAPVARIAYERKGEQLSLTYPLTR